MNARPTFISMWVALASGSTELGAIASCGDDWLHRLGRGLPVHRLWEESAVLKEARAKRQQQSHGKYRYLSQGAQDNYLLHIFDCLGVTNKYFVEYGFNERTYSLAGWSSGAATHALYKLGWNGLLLDGHFVNRTINLQRSFITSKNIVGTLRQAGVRPATLETSHWRTSDKHEDACM